MNFMQRIGIVRDIPGLDPEVVFTIAGFPIASSTLMIFLMTILFAVFCVIVVRTFALRPGKFQAAIEIVYEEVHTLVDQTTNNRKHSERVFPIIATLFIYILIANLIGLIPGLTDITVNGTPIFRSPTADFNTTFGLSFGAVLALQFVSIKEWGLFGHFSKYFQFKQVFQAFQQGVSKGFVALVEFFVGLLDIIGELAKVISLSLRLFGNMYAGNVLMVIIVGALAYGLPAVWLGMNLFVGVLQALVFASLVTAYYMLSVKPEEEEEV